MKSKSTCQYFLALLFVLLLLITGTSHAQTYSAVNDFSTTVNTESSTWSYRFSDDVNRDGSYQLMPVISDAAPIWNPSRPYWNNGYYWPGIGVNNSGGSVYSIGGLVWPDATIWMHPGNNKLAVISWLSPSNLIVNIDYQFGDIDPNGGNSIAWFVDLNDSSESLASGALSLGGTSGSQSLTEVTVNAGERINFVIDPNGGHGYDSTGFTATISVVPEPISSILFLIGGATLGFRRFRKWGTQ